MQNRQCQRIALGVERKLKMTDYIDRKILLLKLHELGGCDADADTWADGYDKAIDLMGDEGYCYCRWTGKTWKWE